MTDGERWDVVLVGGGLAGLTLARHLLLETDRRVLLLERRGELPPRRQKVGESTVQVGGYYLSRVLRLEEHLLREHYMKYNLRFYWKPRAGAADRFQEYSQAYIRGFSNVASYQLDRNKLEGELLRLCCASPRFDYRPGARITDLELAPAGGEEPHEIRYRAEGGERRARARWVVDTSGRGKVLARRMELERPNAIDHGAFFWWVDGLVDVEALTDLEPRAVRLHPSRRHVGHLPLWLATNHFMGEGFWFWVIPLQGKTSLGLVYDRSLVDQDQVFGVEEATAWICREFPLFAGDLPRRQVLDFGGYKDFSYDCRLTLDVGRWAMSGEAGRFSDPLYSPGSDLIAFHNTLVVAAVQAGEEELEALCPLYERLLSTVYAAYEPSYAESYDALGDQECFVLKYTWELTVYFGFYVFPFVNDLITDRRFLLALLRVFSRLGPTNRSLQRLLSGYYRWKKERRSADAEGGPRFVDLMGNDALRAAEEAFYQVGVGVGEAKQILRRQLDNAEELSRFVAAWVISAVLEEPAVMVDRGFLEALDPRRLRFDPRAFRELWTANRSGREDWRWRIDPRALEAFHRPAALRPEVAG